MARSKNGNLIGRAAATELADQRNMLLEDLFAVKRTRIDDLAVSIKVGKSMARQDNLQWPEMFARGLDLLQDIFIELMDICDTDPKHRAVAVREDHAK